jgi:hypothetical protein
MWDMGCIKGRLGDLILISEGEHWALLHCRSMRGSWIEYGEAF